ncbi:MAG TPA: HAMP domain-containing protein, partial [Clostridia bacterium]|nr:HAMP domain-containing protein [Clostridia bacterium]
MIFLSYDTKASKEQPGLIKYSVSLIINHSQAGSAVFLIPKEDFLPSSPGLLTALHLTPIIIALLIISILTFSVYILLNRDIFLPLAKLHESTRRILKGDYNCRIQYDYDTEMGAFCHDFEAMRDELK